MARIYANLIESGQRTYKQVPDRMKPTVKEILIADGHPELVVE